MKNKFLAVLLAGTILTAATAAHAEKSGAWAGIDVGPNSYYLFAGAVTGISGQSDIDSEGGWLLRGDAGYGQYDYNTVLPGPTPANIDGDVIAGDALIGYRHFFDTGANHITFYAGGELQNHDQSPRDAANSVEGSEFGAKGMVELNVTPAEDIVFNAAVSYSTAFDSYWSRGTVGYDMQSVTVGPEVLFMGNEEYDQRRFGLSVSNIQLGFTDVAIRGGYANTSGRGDDGAYGTLGFSSQF
ncbi:MAG: cellulose biosynthesis protein BcsS [Pseudomonadota bacterium]|nr:cellulose biosynthesis protein BcsS [Pseudomonadota bacterium]QKK04685.1 MAG: cellulose biosynthesis protein BcsS [Pseudomonadota bacterium]